MDSLLLPERKKKVISFRVIGIATDEQHVRESSQEQVPAHGALPTGADGAGHLHEPLLVHLRNQTISRTAQESTDLSREGIGSTMPSNRVYWTGLNYKPAREGKICRFDSMMSERRVEEKD